MSFLDLARRFIAEREERTPSARSAQSAERRCATCGATGAVAVAEADGGNRVSPLVVDAVLATPEPAAWRLWSHRLERELWVARDAAVAAQLDRDGVRDGLPVVLGCDLERLRSFDDKRLSAVLDVLALFPGARLAQLDPEAAS